MKYSLSDFPSDAKVWIYQANRLLTEQEAKEISKISSDFTEDWFSHGNALKAYTEVRKNLFLVFLVDEQGDKMCGRAIDGSVKFVQELEKDYPLQFMNRMMVSYKDGEAINVLHLEDFRKKIEAGIVNENTVVYNNLIQTKQELETLWEVPLSRSWMNNLLLVK